MINNNLMGATMHNPSQPLFYQHQQLASAASASLSAGTSTITNRPVRPVQSVLLQPRIDWEETLTTYVIKADVPGLKREDISIEVEDGRVLHLRGEKQRRDGEDGQDGPSSTSSTFLLKERANLANFVRKLDLPDRVNTASVTASIEDGILTVILPRERSTFTSVLIS